MSISQRQFDILQDIGIDLWQLKNTALSIEEEAKPLLSQTEFNALLTSPLFQDILLAINLSADQATLADDHIDLGLINWQFNNDELCHLNAQQLVTPKLETIAKSPEFKKKLWQLLQKVNS